MTLICPDCDQHYYPVAGHCRGGRFGGCCRSFATNRDFDLHRTGPHDGERRCKTEDELLEAGWGFDWPSFWVSPRSLANRVRMAHLAQR